MSQENDGRREGQTLRLVLGDCIEMMQDIPEGTIAAVVTDPPYG